MATASVIGQTTVVRGNVHGDGTLEIFGRVEGDVRIEGEVLIGESSEIKGSVAATQITVAGAVEGDLTGSEALLVESGARVLGDMTAPRIGIANGALVRGTVRTDTAPSPRRATPEVARHHAARAVATAPPLKALPSLNRTAPADRELAEHERAIEERASLRDDDSGKSKKNAKPPPAPIVPSLSKRTKGRKKSRKGA